MRRGRAWRVAAVMAVVGLASAACGDDGSASDGAPAASVGEVDFASAVAKAQDGRFRVVIRYQAGEGPVSESVFAQDPPRQAVIHPDGRMIWDGEHSIVCNEPEGRPPECMAMGDFEVGLAQIGFEASFGALAAAHRALVASVDTFAGWESESAEIAGRPAVCVKLDELPATDFRLGGRGRICADAQTGVIVLMESVGPGGTGERWEAAEVGEPRDEDFEPPVDPTELTLPTMPEFPEGPDITIPDIP